MLLQKEYYSNKLYPLQDVVLSVISQCETNFYLTGGTALSRMYLHHRYSDDLDFFLNGADDFSVQVDRVISAFNKAAITFRIDKRATDFVRMQCSDAGTSLKVDFVNDVSYHSGTMVSDTLFPRVDDWWNILSNKITALDRREPKDIVDILFLCRKYSFEWELVFQEAHKKTLYIDPLDSSVIISEFPREYFSRIQWVRDVDLEVAYNDLQKIANDILRKKTNSLTIK